jgi:hypothetical protein
LEVVIVELQPDFFKEVDKVNFMRVKFQEKKIVTITNMTMDVLSTGPRTVSQIDEMHDFRDRAMANIAGRVGQSGSSAKAPGESQQEKDAPEDVPESLLRVIGFFQAWQVWGRAITSLDFVELSVRKPSFLRLLDQWARIASAMSEAGSSFLNDIFEKQGKPLPQEEKDRMEYIARVNMPISSVQSIFSHIGSNSIHRLLIETFDELDISSAEALGAVCMLIKQMPDGWDRRVEKYIDERIRTDNGNLKYFILEALTSEYVNRVLDKKQLRAIQGLLAHLLTHGGFIQAKTEVVLNQLQQSRVKLEMLTGAGTR